ncbi:MAG: hypothetical protein ACKVK5_10690 [Pseudomonadales bacterium]
MSGVVNVPGIEVPFTGGQTLTIPPLSLGALEQLLDRINAVMGGASMDVSSIGTVIDAAHAALKRNYPEMTRDQVGDLVDLANMREVLEAVMSASGLEAKPVDASGEALAP